MTGSAPDNTAGGAVCRGFNNFANDPAQKGRTELANGFKGLKIMPLGFNGDIILVQYYPGRFLQATSRAFARRDLLKYSAGARFPARNCKHEK